MNIEINNQIEQNAEKMIQSLQKLVKIRSVIDEPSENAPYGIKSRQAMQAAMDIAQDLGFEKIVNIEDRVCYIEYGEGENVVGVFAHLDIVPEGENWTYHPFSGEIHDNCIYGRGTVDNKGPFIASLFALKAIKDSGIKLNSRIRIVGGTNEETGCQDMQYYLNHCGAPTTGFTPDGLFPMSFTERGIDYYTLHKEFSVAPSNIRIIEFKGGEILNMVPDKASAILEAENMETAASIYNDISSIGSINDCTISASLSGTKITITSSGLCAHSCTPFNGRNAIVALIMLLYKLEINGSIGDFVNFFMKKISNTTDGSLMGMKRSDICGNLTFSVSKIDLNEDRMEMIVNIRYPYTYKDEVCKDFESNMSEGKISVSATASHKPYCYPMDHPLITTLRKVYAEMTGKDSTPCNEGGTYAKVIPNIVPFGSIFPGSIDYCHRPNENVNIDELILDAKIYGNAMYELSKIKSFNIIQ